MKKLIEIKNVDGVFIDIENNELIICGSPNDDDENHNCDEMGCSSVRHVLFRCWAKSKTYGFTVKEGNETDNKADVCDKRVDLSKLSYSELCHYLAIKERQKQ